MVIKILSRFDRHGATPRSMCKICKYYTSEPLHNSSKSSAVIYGPVMNYWPAVCLKLLLTGCIFQCPPSWGKSEDENNTIIMYCQLWYRCSLLRGTGVPRCQVSEAEGKHRWTHGWRMYFYCSPLHLPAITCLSTANAHSSEDANIQTTPLYVLSMSWCDSWWLGLPWWLTIFLWFLLTGSSCLLKVKI